jgi:hypothetical protein
MRSDLGPVFYHMGFWGMIVLIPISAFLLVAGPELQGSALKLVFWLPFVAFWMFLKARKWRDEGHWQ